MTVASQTSHIEYVGNGVTVAFAVPFRFLEDSHLAVYLRVIATDVRSLLILNGDYTVTGAGENSGGTVTTTVAYSALYQVEIERAVPITQETDYEPNDPFPAESHEDALDKLTMICQQLLRNIDLLEITVEDIADALVITFPVTSRYQSWAVACSDRDTAIAAGNTVGRFRLPYDFTIVGIMADLNVAQTGGTRVTVDANKNGTTILSTKLTIDNAEKSSLTAATPCVLTSTTLLAGDEITFDIDAIGDGTAKWLQVTLYGYQTAP